MKNTEGSVHNNLKLITLDYKLEQEVKEYITKVFLVSFI